MQALIDDILATTRSAEFKERVTELLMAICAIDTTPFADVGPSTTLGLEMNLDSNLEGFSLVLLVPQVHQEIGKRTMIQAGAGVEWVSGEPGGTLAARAIYAF